MKYYETYESKPALDKRIEELRQMGLTRKDYEVVSKARIEGTDVDYVDEEVVNEEPVSESGIMTTHDIYEDRRDNERSFFERIKDFFTGEDETDEHLVDTDIDSDVHREAIELVRKGHIVLFIDEDKLEDAKAHPVRDTSVVTEYDEIRETETQVDDRYSHEKVVDPADPIVPITPIDPNHPVDAVPPVTPVDHAQINAADREPTLHDHVDDSTLLDDIRTEEPNLGDNLDNRTIIEDPQLEPIEDPDRILPEDEDERL